MRLLSSGLRRLAQLAQSRGFDMKAGRLGCCKTKVSGPANRNRPTLICQTAFSTTFKTTPEGLDALSFLR